jgi:hypothetical protein
MRIGVPAEIFECSMPGGNVYTYEGGSKGKLETILRLENS